MPCYKPVTLYKSSKGPGPNGKTPLVGKSRGNLDEPVQVPCGRCTDCRLEYSRQWAIRCVLEIQMQEKSCFLTLTLNEENITYGGKAYTLYPRELQLFLKRLRKKYGKGIRFFACGEYGDINRRPHYHLLVFGHNFNEDKTLYKIRDGIPLYVSEQLDNLWRNPETKKNMGLATVGEANFETAAYVARYILKKKLGKTSRFYDEQGIEPEFVRMSRGGRGGLGGIGSSWYDKFKTDVFPYDEIVIRGGVRTKPPRFYLGKYELENPEKYATLKERRKKAAEKHAKDNTPARLREKEKLKNIVIKKLLRTV